MYKKILVVLLFAYTNLTGQNTDSLRTLAFQSTGDSARAQAFVELGKAFIMVHEDSSLKYLEKAGSLSKALGNYTLYKKVQDTKAKVHLQYQKFDQALKIYQHLIDSAQHRGDTIKIVDTYVDMSLVYYNLGKPNDFLKHNRKALDQLGSKEWGWKGQIYSNIGTYYMSDTTQQDSTRYYFDLAIAEHRKNGKDHLIPHVYTNLGTYYYYKGTPEGYEKALESYTRARDVLAQNNDDYGLATATLNMGYAYMGLEQYEEAEQIALEARKLFDQQNDNLGVSDCMSLLTDIYKRTGSYEKAFYALDSLYVLDKKIRGIEEQKAIAELETKYETVKKEKENEKLKSENQLKNEEIKRKNILNYSMLGGLVLLVVIVVLIYIQFQNKKKANLALASKNREIEEKNEEIEAQRDQLEIQNEALHEYMTETSDSINYAKRIQGAMLSTGHTRTPMPDHFILFQPKDVVSGDFYWTGERNGYLYITAADCTGHGVPGAFMSMLGISFLNNIIKSDTLLTPSQILEELRSRVITELGQSAGTENKDGMDMSLIRYHPASGELIYAGANNPLYIVTEDAAKMQDAQQVVESEENGKKLVEYKADKQPIGFLEGAGDFHDHTFTIQPGESVYLFSDGYADQFGGPSNKKFGYRSFKRFLLELQPEPSEVQHQKLDRKLARWMTQADEPQVDDICVIGIRF